MQQHKAAFQAQKAFGTFEKQAASPSCSKEGHRYPLGDTYPLDRDLSDGKCYPAFEQPGPGN